LSSFRLLSVFVFSNLPDITALYTLSLHDALPICSLKTIESSGASQDNRCSMNSSCCGPSLVGMRWCASERANASRRREGRSVDKDRKSTRLNSSHVKISYAVFCLKKKKKPYLRRT